MLRVGVLLAVSCVPSAAWAQTPAVEIGASLASATIGVGDHFFHGPIFGVPNGDNGWIRPVVYASFFVLPRLALEPQLALVVSTFNGRLLHNVNLGGQVDYFFTDVGSPAAYVFGSASIVDTSGIRSHPKSISAGLGYRVPVGENLAFRLDGRYARVTTENAAGNAIAFTFSIGGLFGKR
jgi:hypothetical protein